MATINRSWNKPKAQSSTYIDALRVEIDDCIETLLPDHNQHPANLHMAMRHSLLAGGKRVRPLFCLLISEAADQKGRSFAMNAGCAIELVHTASLILDDLPCMDNAATRRGRPATHAAFGQATAILAAVGLLNRAFGIVAEQPGESTHSIAQAIQILSEAIGSNGMIAGQQIDLHERSGLEGTSPIETLNRLKTGSLFVASGHIGALAAGLPPRDVDVIRRFAEHVGLAFQIADDLIDHTADPETVGKDVRQDGDKPTIVLIDGVQAAQTSCEEHLRLARLALEKSSLETGGLLDLVDSVFGRGQ